MFSGFLYSVAALLLLWPGQSPSNSNPTKPQTLGQATSSGKVDANRNPSQKKTGRPGELTREEEDKLDRIVHNFILHDLGVQPSQSAVDALRDLGPEAIPALVRGINYSATLSHSCPVTVLAAKLDSLIRSCDDPYVLSFIRSEVGAGLKVTKYAGLLTKLRVQTSLRASQLQRQKLAELKKDPGRSLGDSFGKSGNEDK